MDASACALAGWRGRTPADASAGHAERPSPALRGTNVGWPWQAGDAAPTTYGGAPSDAAIRRFGRGMAAVYRDAYGVDVNADSGSWESASALAASGDIEYAETEYDENEYAENEYYADPHTVRSSLRRQSSI